MNRREILIAALALASLTGSAEKPRRKSREFIKDFAGLERYEVQGIATPTNTTEVQALVSEHTDTLSIGGARYSMGGQIAAPNSLHLDMRKMNRIVQFDPNQCKIRVQAGITWRDIQEHIDPHDSAIQIMQSYSNFSVGGSVGVNCHGRYVGAGPLTHSILSLQLVTADGQQLELTPDDELFKAVVGGYGGIGVVTEVELQLAQNAPLERIVEKVQLEDYPAYFHSNIEQNPNVVLHNADLRPPQFSSPRLINWVATGKQPTVTSRLIPRDKNYTKEQTLLWAVSELPGAKRLRRRVEDRLLQQDMVVWRNYEASLDVDMLEPRSRLFTTYLLQEYFIPVENFLPFTTTLRSVLRRHNVNALNVSIRHSPPDRSTLLSWAPTEVFSFVLFYKQRRGIGALRQERVWTQTLLDAVIENGGTYYLPYRRLASQKQFNDAYPRLGEFLSQKQTYDPTSKFTNHLLDTYF